MEKLICDKCGNRIDPEETFNVLSVADLGTKEYPLSIEIFGDFYNLCKPCIHKFKNNSYDFIKKKYFTAQELADKLDVNIMTIYRYIEAKKFKAYKIGKEFRIDKEEFNKFLNSVKTT